MKVICDCFRCQGKIVDYRTAQNHQDSVQIDAEDIICKLCTPHHSISWHNYYAYHRAEVLHLNQGENISKSPSLHQNDDEDTLMLDTNNLQTDCLDNHANDSIDNLSATEEHLTHHEEDATTDDGNLEDSDEEFSNSADSITAAELDASKLLEENSEHGISSICKSQFIL